MKTLSLRFTNVDCSSEGRTFTGLEAAVEHGRECGFAFAVWQGDKMVATWGQFEGLRIMGAADVSEARRIAISLL